MKIIPKFQKGGGFESLFTTYVPVQAPQQTRSVQTSQSERSSRQDSDDDDKGKLTEKDFYAMLKNIDGLPNEMQSIVSHLIDTLSINKIAGIELSDLSTTYLQSLYRIRQAVNNKKQYDDAYKRAIETGAISEPAITVDGKLVIQDKEGHIRQVSLGDFMNNRDRYETVLTVSNLLNLRAYNPSFANDFSIFDIANNSVGYQSFQKLVKEAVHTLGSTQVSREGIFSNEGQASKGLQLLQTLSQDDRVAALGSVTSEGLYKYKIINKTQKAQIDALTAYISRMLPDSAKTWAALKLGTSNKDNAVRSLITIYLAAGANEEHDFSINYLGSMEKVEGKSKSSKNGDEKGINDLDLNTPGKFIAGYGQRSTFVLNPGTIASMQILSTSLPLTDKNDKAIGPNSTLQQAAEGNFSGILDFTNVSMGGNMLDSGSFRGVVLSDGRIHSIDYPIDMVAFSRDGTIKPDTSPQTIKAKQSAEVEIKRMGINLDDLESIKVNYNTINNIYQKYNLSPAYNNDGTPTQAWRRFGVINASADNNILNMGYIDNNPLLKEVKDETTIDNLLEIVKDENFDKPGIIFGGDHFYTGTVWIPIISDYHSALVGTNQTGGEAYSLDVASQARDQINNYKSGRQVQ